MRRVIGLACAITALGMLAFASGAYGHAERLSYFPNAPKATNIVGSVPAHRSIWSPSKKLGKRLVVCKSDSKKRIKKLLKGKQERRNLRLLKRCKFHDVQAAVNAASNNARILITPGVYKEEPSRAEPQPDPKCKDDYEDTGAEGRVPNYEYQVNCPNAQNEIAILGDGPDKDRVCDTKCNIQIEGTGRKSTDVLITGERAKLNVIRADRADGIYLRNFAIEFSDFNNIYVLETNGFVFDKITSRYSREYGFLSFASDHGLYDNLVAYGSGDSGLYPGGTAEGNCKRYAIEIRNSDSFGNNLGYSGTAGNSVWAHDNKFHDNSTGMTTDSFAPNHPGMPQDCAKWEHNEIYSNNLDLFSNERQEYCKKPVADRDPKIVCSTFQNPTGTGTLIAGGNRNIVKDNFIYDNWRNGTMLHWVPASLRGEDPTGQSENNGDQFDTSNGNRYEGNHMGVRPDGTRDPNGTDFWWDEEGHNNCWTQNTGPNGTKPKSDPSSLPDCPGSDLLSPGNSAKQAMLVPCALWDSHDNTNPPGCDWMTRPSEPK